MHTTRDIEDTDLITTDTAMVMEGAEEEVPAVVEGVEDVAECQFRQSSRNLVPLNGRNLAGLEAKFRPMVFITLCNHILPTKAPTVAEIGPQALQACQATVRANFQQHH
jgi:hypothetical protein